MATADRSVFLDCLPVVASAADQQSTRVMIVSHAQKLTIPQRCALALFDQISKKRTASIGDIKWLANCRGVDIFDHVADLLGVLATYHNEGVIEPVLVTDLHRHAWSGFIDGSLENETLLDGIHVRFRQRKRDQYRNDVAAFLDVIIDG